MANVIETTRHWSEISEQLFRSQQHAAVRLAALILDILWNTDESGGLPLPWLCPDMDRVEEKHHAGT